MTEIITERLSIKPTHKNCWSVFDQFDGQLIGKLFFRKQWFNIILKPQSLRLGVASEASYGLMKAINSPVYQAKTELPHAQEFLVQLGFKGQNDHFKARIEQLTRPEPYASLNQKLGIHTKTINQPIHLTAAQLVDSDIDCFDRPTKLHPKAHKAWQQLKRAALSDGVKLSLVSAFRSMSYQAGLIKNKLETGQHLKDILCTNTPPGHSEHHTGCAIDITTEGFEPLAEAFEQSQAFVWLTDHAAEFDFFMSYPRDNSLGIIYEPWHWCYHQQK